MRLFMAFALIICFQQDSQAQEKNAKFSELFAAGGLGSDIVVQVPDDTTLLFDGGEFFLEGKTLLVIAGKANVDGATTIRSFSPQNVPGVVEGTPATPSPATGTAATGTSGATGIVGNPGAPSGIIVLNISEVAVAAGATLQIFAQGQIGGKGQKGGQGGRGGPGKSGRNAKSDFPSCSRPCPSTGDRGGPGGRRGSAGVGGTGGVGGTVYVTQVVQNLIATNNLLIDIAGGSGGQMGEVGERGIGGPGGPRGSGGNCECKDPPPPGPDGLLGDDNAVATPSSQAGADGQVLPL